MRQLVFALLFLGLVSSQARAQFYPTQYRPPDLNWQQLTTPHFKIVFPQGEDSSAWETGRILENHYEGIRSLTGGSLKNFPVILNNYNDIANGFVTPFHFRSEIELSPFKGKSINPRSGSWLDAVVPHELVHAMHFNNSGSKGLTKMIRFFSPDMARSMHGAVPFGIHEGLAVHYETEAVTSDGGRGNYPYFTNQFNAVFDSPQRWSMGQMVQVTSNTRPFGRHYLGGYEFTSWLQKRFGPETSRKAIRFYADFPFLGYGVALRHATGEWPNELYDEFESDKKEELKSRNPASNTIIDPLPIPYEGASVRRPKWLSDSSLVFYGTFYNARSGFYRYDLNSGKLSRLTTTGTVQDFAYDLSSDKSRLIYSYYETSPVYSNTFSAELIEFDINSHTRRQLSKNQRLYAPVYSNDQILSLQTAGTTSRLVRFNPDSQTQVHPVAAVAGTEIVSVAAHPKNPERLAVVANRQGQQALWVGTIDSLQNELAGTPDVYLSGGSIFDPVWHPEGDRVLLASDETGALNIYEFNISNNTLTRITNSPFNAFEASYSPDGNSIAFILQMENKHLPAVLVRKDFYDKVVSVSPWPPNRGQSALSSSNSNNEVSADQTWKTAPYSSGVAWLKPRAMVPVVEEVSNRGVYKVGASFHSNDLLQQQSYSAEAAFIQNRLWYDLTYRNTSFYPGFEASAYSRPSYVNLAFDTTVDTVVQTMLRQERSLALAMPVSYTLERNVFQSSFFVRPKIRQSQIRFFELDHSGNAASGFANVTIANIYASFRYRLQQNIRDVQPNTGLILFSEIEQYLWPEGLTIRTLSAEFQRSFTNSFGVRGGVFAYLSPLRRWNQSLRLDVRILNQNNFLFDNQFLVSEGFSEPVFPFSGNLLSMGTRYTIPLWHPDDGGFLLPGYLSNVYLVAFTNTVGRFTQPDFLSASRTVLGAGIRAQFRLSNLAFDLGIGFGFEPGRNKANVFVGNF